jgi:septum formation protein
MHSAKACNILRHRCRFVSKRQVNLPSEFIRKPWNPPRADKTDPSPFRKQLLDRLQLDYECHSPDVDESLLDGETADAYVCRLAEAKARVIAQQNPRTVVIGSDQCALFDGQILGKPGSHEIALQQLRRAQGKSVVFHTAVCVMSLATDFVAVEDVPFTVQFRELSDQQLDHYLRVEQPYQCAGSFKAEGYGSCLFSRMNGDDPSALIGLPLIKLTQMLEAAGIEVV